MKYRVTFLYTVAVLKNGINFQGKRGAVQVCSDQPVDMEDPAHRHELENTVYYGLQRQLKPGELLIGNKFAITEITPEP